MILDQITSQVRGIVWLTSQPLSKLPSHFKDLDYLFDGIISKKISQTEVSESPFEKNLFSGKSFEKDLLLIQLWGTDSAKLNKELLEALALVPAKEEEGSKIIVLGEEASKFPEKNFKAKFKIKYQILT